MFSSLCLTSVESHQVEAIVAAATAQNDLEKEVAALTKARDAAMVDEEEKEKAFAQTVAKQRSEWEREVRCIFSFIHSLFPNTHR